MQDVISFSFNAISCGLFFLKKEKKYRILWDCNCIRIENIINMARNPN